MPTEEAIIEPKPRRPRQMRLFAVVNPLSERLGDPFFRALPRQPGVYFFYDETDRLLYIGQSNNLRARIGSYRHVNLERHARRTVRLVHRVRRIEWEICGSVEAAIERERQLLLEHRPPFNRAGVWQAPLWWLRMTVHHGHLHLSLARQEAPISPGPDETDVFCLGPFRASFPMVYAALVRAAMRRCFPTLQITDFPAGYLGDRLVTEVTISSGTFTKNLADTLVRFLTGLEGGEALNLTSPGPNDNPSTSMGFYGTFDRQLWEMDAELLQDFFERQAVGYRVKIS